MESPTHQLEIWQFSGNRVAFFIWPVASEPSSRLEGQLSASGGALLEFILQPLQGIIWNAPGACLESLWASGLLILNRS